MNNNNALATSLVTMITKSKDQLQFFYREHFIDMFLRSDGDIQVDVYPNSEYCEHGIEPMGGGIIEMEDYYSMDKSELRVDLIKEKIDFIKEIVEDIIK